MDWKELAGVVGKVAPMLGGLLTGPLGAAVSVGGIIASALGTDNTPEAIDSALKANPDLLLKLREVESNNRVRLEELSTQRAANELQADTEAQRIAAGDRASARQREVSTADSGTPRLLAFFVTLGFFGVLGYLLHYGKPQAGGDALLVMLGSLGGAWTAIVAYYFGSSAGSARKDLTIQAQATKP